MSGIISYCGLICKRCTIYLAAREADKVKKGKMILDIINICKAQYGINYTHEDITGCDCCKSQGGILFSGCKNCKIRRCAVKKGIENCAYCKEYACEELSGLITAEPGAKTRLDTIRNSI